MTGFGRGSSTTDAWQAGVEISSVNRKQSEVVLQAPRELYELDTRIRKAVLAAVSRGRVQVSITVTPHQATAEEFKIDAALALAFSKAFGELGRTVGYPVPPTAADFLRQPGIISTGTREIDVEAAWLAIEPALGDALTQLVAMRANEGEHLKADFWERLGVLHSYVRRIESEAPGRPKRQRELLTKRLRDVGLELDPTDERVAKEIALFADRCDVSEEITRLDSHFVKFREYVQASEPPGRALDFLCQELFREFNTIGSKANDASIAQTIVEAKTELEKIREQVQNVE
ncbi:YicC family protein [Luteolibacter yonseiensis]